MNGFDDDDSIACVELCETCFSNNDVVHNHATFCRISSAGLHEAIVRDVGLGTRFPVVMSDLRVARPGPEDNTECPVCLTPFGEDTIPVHLPGCTAHSTTCTRDAAHGCIDRHQFMCRDCTMQWLAATGRDVYCSRVAGEGFTPPYCDMCVFLADKQQWHHVFVSAMRRFADLVIACMGRGDCVPVTDRRRALHDAMSGDAVARIANELLLPDLPRILCAAISEETRAADAVVALDLAGADAGADVVARVNERDGSTDTGCTDSKLMSALVDLVGGELHRLHKQPWLRAVIAECVNEVKGV